MANAATHAPVGVTELEAPLEVLVDVDEVLVFDVPEDEVDEVVELVEDTVVEEAVKDKLGIVFAFLLSS